LLEPVVRLLVPRRSAWAAFLGEHEKVVTGVGQVTQRRQRLTGDEGGDAVLETGVPDGRCRVGWRGGVLDVKNHDVVWVGIDELFEVGQHAGEGDGTELAEVVAEIDVPLSV